MNAEEYFKEHYKHLEIQMVAKESAIHFADAYLKHKTESQKSAIPIVSDCFSFAKFLQENFEFHDNTKNGNVYFHKKRKGIFIEQNIYDEWLNNR